MRWNELASILLLIPGILAAGCATVPPEVKVDIRALGSEDSIERGYAVHRLGRTPEHARRAVADIIEILDYTAQLQWYKGVLSHRPSSWSGPYPGPRETSPRRMAVEALVRIGEP